MDLTKAPRKTEGPYKMKWYQYTHGKDSTL